MQAWKRLDASRYAHAHPTQSLRTTPIAASITWKAVSVGRLTHHRALSSARSPKHTQVSVFFTRPALQFSSSPSIHHHLPLFRGLSSHLKLVPRPSWSLRLSTRPAYSTYHHRLPPRHLSGRETQPQACQPRHLPASVNVQYHSHVRPLALAPTIRRCLLVPHSDRGPRNGSHRPHSR